jgi:hypothetical protein
MRRSRRPWRRPWRRLRANLPPGQPRRACSCLSPLPAPCLDGRTLARRARGAMRGIRRGKKNNPAAAFDGASPPQGMGVLNPCAARGSGPHRAYSEVFSPGKKTALRRLRSAAAGARAAAFPRGAGGSRAGAAGAPRAAAGARAAAFPRGAGGSRAGAAGAPRAAAGARAAASPEALAALRCARPDRRGPDADGRGAGAVVQRSDA